jgi:peptidoglycan hydrolase-like protein with peptidoglycan-binding domain
MNFTTLLGLIPTIIRIVDFMKRVFTQGLSINSLGTIFQNEDVKTVFTMLGELLFPKVRPELQAAAAAAALYAPDYVMKVQNAANVLLSLNPPLDVDGHYGPKTKAAVEALQKKLGLEQVDGWVGDKSMAAIQAALLKKTDQAKANIPAPAIAQPQATEAAT